MSDIYTPDGFIAVKISHEGKTVYRILGDWRGSYLYGASWRLSSRIEKIEELDEEFCVKNESGSIYMLRKGAEDRLGSMGMSILADFQNKVGAEKFVPISIGEVMRILATPH